MKISCNAIFHESKKSRNHLSGVLDESFKKGKFKFLKKEGNEE